MLYFKSVCLPAFITFLTALTKFMAQKQVKGAGGMEHLAKTPTTKPEDLGLSPGTHTVE